MLRIRDWKSVFENARSREIKRLEWVSIPNRHDGSKYAELMEHERGAEHFAAWILMVQVASRCGILAERRGILAERRGELRKGDGSPHNSRSLFLVTRCPERIFEEAIPRLISIGWLENAENSEKTTIPQEATRIPQDAATSRQNVPIGGEGMGSEGTGERAPRTASKPTSQLDVDRAQAVIDAYPMRAKKDGRVIRKDLHGQNILAARIAMNPNFPWEEAAHLEGQSETPRDLHRWAESMPDPVLLESLRKAAKATRPRHQTEPGEYLTDYEIAQAESEND